MSRCVRKLLCCAMALWLSTVFCVTAVKAEAVPVDAVPSVSAQGAILIEAESGSVIYQKNAQVSLPMASTTKIMTAIVAMEQTDVSAVVTVPKQAVGIEGSSVYLYEGEQLTMEDLLYALLLESANDAATAIAVLTAGSVEAFADLMNQKAEELGLSGTHFTNPHGLDNEKHYTTAQDLATLTAYCLKNPMFATIVATKRKTIPLRDTEGVRLLLNHNRLLRTLDGAIGVKTGYTKRSGRCLVSACNRDGVTLIAVTINAPNDWEDHTQMYRYGFERFERIVLTEPGAMTFRIPVVGGMASEVTVTNPESVSLVMPKGHGEIRYCVELPRWLPGGIAAGQQLGQIVYSCDGQRIASVALNATDMVEKIPAKKSFIQRIVDFICKNGA